MKTFSLLVKYIVIPCSSVIGIIYGFDMYVIQRAGTVVKPVEVKVESLETYSKIHMERVERELIMIRHQNEDTNKYLREMRD